MTHDTAAAFVFRFVFCAIILFIISFPFGYYLIPDAGQLSQSLFTRMAVVAGKLLGIGKSRMQLGLVSDSTLYYLNALVIFMVSAVIASGWMILGRKKRSDHILQYWLLVLVRYYLALQLMIYGFSKIFKAQFYLPEPNILYTPLGQLSGDILYWSTMGISRPYSVFLGSVELLAAILILFRKTVFAGAVAAAFILFNIVAINLAFDISVKLFSIFLLLLSIYLISHFRKHSFATTNLKKQVYVVMKVVVITLLLAESMFLYLKTGNFNDDAAERPFLHGAYKVDSFRLNNQVVPPLLTDTVRWKNVFVHRRGYLIIQWMDDRMRDVELEVDEANNRIELISTHTGAADTLEYTVPEVNRLKISGFWENKNISLYLTKQDLTKLPAMSKSFHWTIDE